MDGPLGSMATQPGVRPYGDGPITGSTKCPTDVGHLGSARASRVEESCSFSFEARQHDRQAHNEDPCTLWSYAAVPCESVAARGREPQRRREIPSARRVDHALVAAVITHDYDCHRTCNRMTSGHQAAKGRKLEA